MIYGVKDDKILTYVILETEKFFLWFGKIWGCLKFIIVNLELWHLNTPIWSMVNSKFELQKNFHWLKSSEILVWSLWQPKETHVILEI